MARTSASPASSHSLNPPSSQLGGTWSEAVRWLLLGKDAKDWARISFREFTWYQGPSKPCKKMVHLVEVTG